MPPLKIRTLSFKQIVLGLILVIIVIVFSSYVLWQARFLILGPQVTLTSVIPYQTNDTSIEITGQASNITDITLNGRPLETNQQGEFRELLVLENGLTTFTLSVKDLYGRTRTIERNVVYQPLEVNQDI